jgi:hypothetical protein
VTENLLADLIARAGPDAADVVPVGVASRSVQRRLALQLHSRRQGCCSSGG